ncbi:hypothetical protein MRB53_003651 [Persea americana]|uniref:Uncharacterized protein n=1 Tax=Persea americana TaxID=3435 RepID=A0ACC2MYN9_PERAE|nr:hypothetical protein MRB53_003651 [Persea americana]
MKETNMVFDLQDLFIGKNTTAFPVVKRSEEATVIDFGTSVIDDAVTEGRKKTSAQVGRAQGIYENPTLDGSSTHLAFSIIFNNSKYKPKVPIGEPLWYRRRQLTE